MLPRILKKMIQACAYSYSTKRTSSVLIPESMLATINNEGLDPDDAAALAEIGILVPDRQTEDEEMLSLFPLADLKRDFTAVAVMNLDCNLACRYCFEGTMKRKEYMSEQTANDLIDFTNGYLRQGKDVVIRTSTRRQFHPGKLRQVPPAP